MKTNKKRHSYGRFAAIMLLLTLLLTLGLVLNLNIGSVQIPAGEIFRMLLGGDDASTESRILFGIRIPRILLAAVLQSQIGRAVQQECRDRSRMPSSA